MGKILFTSDLHFGHKNILKYDKRPFESVEEMDEELITRWNKKVEKDDTVYLLGDISWYDDEKTANILNQLNGTIILIKGNHDKLGPLVRKRFAQVHDYLELRMGKRRIVLCHYPVMCYNLHHHDGVMLYGHVHNSQDDVFMEKVIAMANSEGIPHLMFNVGCMKWNYEPVTLEEMLETTSPKVA